MRAGDRGTPHSRRCHSRRRLLHGRLRRTVPNRTTDNGRTHDIMATTGKQLYVLDRAVEQYYRDWLDHDDREHITHDTPVEFVNAVRALYDAATNVLIDCGVIQQFDGTLLDTADDGPTVADLTVDFVHELAIWHHGSAVLGSSDHGVSALDIAAARLVHALGGGAVHDGASPGTHDRGPVRLVGSDAVMQRANEAFGP